MLQALESTVETLQELDEDKNDEVSLQQALGWASVAASRAEVTRLDRQLSVSAPQARSLAEAEQEEAAAQLKQLETSVEQQVRHSCKPSLQKEHKERDHTRVCPLSVSQSNDHSE